MKHSSFVVLTLGLCLLAACEQLASSPSGSPGVAMQEQVTTCRESEPANVTDLLCSPLAARVFRVNGARLFQTAQYTLLDVSSCNFDLAGLRSQISICLNSDCGEVPKLEEIAALDQAIGEKAWTPTTIGQFSAFSGRIGTRGALLWKTRLSTAKRLDVLAQQLGSKALVAAITPWCAPCSPNQQCGAGGGLGPRVNAFVEESPTCRCDCDLVRACPPAQDTCGCVQCCNQEAERDSKDDQ